MRKTISVPGASLARARRSTVCVVCGLLAAACETPDSRISGLQAVPPDLRQYVLGNAAASLNEDGLFTLVEPEAPGTRPIISEKRAGEIALSVVRTWERSLRELWERESGRSIDVASLQVGPRTFFAHTPYGEFPNGYHPAFGRTYGPYYLVPLYSGAQPVLLVSVAAYNEAVTIDQRGLIRRPVDHGMEFLAMALPADTGAFRIVSPEEAVARVGRATRARVSATPELVRAGMPQAPAAALWKLTLDREVPVRARGRGTAHRVRNLYVGPERGRRLMMAVPASVRTERVAAIGAGESDQIVPVDVPILDGEAVSFEPVDVEIEGAHP